MRSVTEGKHEMTPSIQRHLELCLDCRACETACPSGVQYGKLIEPFRVAMTQTGAEIESPKSDWFRKYILFWLMPNPKRLRNMLFPARVAQALRLDRLASATGMTKLLPDKLRRMVEMLPPKPKEDKPLPEVLPAIGEKRATVALFIGCVADAMFRNTHWATARVLQQNGVEVHVVSGQACCGAIHFHAGDSDEAKKLADLNAIAFQDEKFDAVISNVAGCGAMMKDYAHQWPGEGERERAALADKTRDINEFLFELGFIPPKGTLRGIATYHDACHLRHAQKIAEAPRKLLAQIQGLVLRDLPETEVCCGAAGTYNLTEPEMAERLSRRKIENIHSTGANVVITSNAGCLLQIASEAKRQGTPLRLMHPMDVLDMAYREKSRLCNEAMV